MADLRDVLRSFALQKMQEIKDEGKEKDRRSRDESSSSSSKKKKKDRKRSKDESSSSEHKSKRQTLSESSKHDKHHSHHHHHHRSHREKSESRTKDEDTGKLETKTKSDKDDGKAHLDKDVSKSKTDKDSRKTHSDRPSKSHLDKDTIKLKSDDALKSKSDRDASKSKSDRDASKSKSDKDSRKTHSEKTYPDKDALKSDKDYAKKDPEKVYKSYKDTANSKSNVLPPEDKHDTVSESPASSGRPGRVKINRRSFSLMDGNKSDELAPKESDKKEHVKSSALKDIMTVEMKRTRNDEIKDSSDDVMRVGMKRTRNDEIKDDSDDIIEIKQIRKIKVKPVGKDDDVIEITIGNTKEDIKHTKKDVFRTRKMDKDIIETKKTDKDSDKKKTMVKDIDKSELEINKAETKLEQISTPFAPTTKVPTTATKPNTVKAEKKIIKINIVTKDLKVPTPPPSPPPKKPKKELEDGELSESQSDIESESESDIESDSESELEEEGEAEATPDGREVPWREQGSSEGEASSTSDSEQEGKEIPLGDAQKDKDAQKEGQKSKKQKHKHKHKKHKHKKGKENEKGDSKSPKDVKSGEDGEKKKSKHKKDKKEKKKDKKDTKEDGEVKDKDSEKDKDRSRSDKRKHRSRSRSRSKSHHKHSRRSKSPDRSYERSRNRSRSRSRDRDRSGGSNRGIWTRDLRARRRARSRSRDRDRRRRSRSYTPEEIDKKKLYEIAKANAYAQLQRGELPQNLLHKLPPLTQEDKVAQKAGGRTVAELTQVCMQLARKRGANDNDDDSDSDASPINKLIGSDEEAEGPFIRHPFNVKDKPLNIVMNIKNAVPLPVKDKETLRLQFPVSSGTQHRRKEDEISVKNPYGDWQIVERDKLRPAPTQPKPVPPPKPVAVPVVPDPILPLLGTNITGPSEAAQALASAVTTTAEATISSATATASSSAMPAIMAPPPPPPVPAPVPAPTPVEDKVFEDVAAPTMDIGSIVSVRLKAARALESNPHDIEALSLMHRSQTEIKNWTLAKQKPGMFTGNTGIKLLSPVELANSNPKKQAWATKDMFHNQPALRGGIGMHLMQKMGWKQGEGLGIANQGQLEPLALDVKTDRKGLVALDEQHRKKNQLSQAVYKDLSGKHPVSALMEICNKRRWRPPQFELMEDTGPAHKKSFMFKVIINNDIYIPSMPSQNKKQAKASAASAALMKMGLIPA